MRDFILFESAFWDPVLIFALLLLAFWQTCSVKKTRRNYVLQAGLLLFYMAAITALAAFFMLEPDRDPRENLAIAAATVFFLGSSLAMLFAARAWLRNYGFLRAALMLILMFATAFAAVWFYTHHGLSLPAALSGLPFAVTCMLIFTALAAALALEGCIYDLLVFRWTNLRVLCLYALAVTCMNAGYYLYMSRGLTRVFAW